MTRNGSPVNERQRLDDPLFGLVAEFDSAKALVDAARHTHAHGYRKVSAYSPFPVEGAAEALGFHHSRVSFLVLIGGVTGGAGGLLLQWWSSSVAYPLNIGGRPLASWPMLMPVTFECTVLVGALACVLGMLALNGLPQPYHPIFAVEGFERASSDRFFLCVRTEDPLFDRHGTEVLLKELGPLRVSEVPISGFQKG
jgi:hypothetical protein